MPSFSATTEVQRDRYHMTRSPGQPEPPERYSFLFIVSSSIRVISWTFYVVYRFCSVWQAQNKEHIFLWQLWTVLFAEFFLSVEDILTTVGIIYQLFTFKSFQVRPRYCLMGSSAPTIDVCVTCCGEPADIISDTLASAAAQNYPRDRFRVLLLDDGGDRKLEEATEILAMKYVDGPRILYRSRKLLSGVQSYYKAGNLQYGLEETEKLGGSQYFATLDADMIPTSDWLGKVVPHLILDDKVALACPPQTYYNIPEGDPFGQQADLKIASTLYEPLNERVNGSACTGSGFIARRSALNEIGGWPLFEAGEDYMCSALLSTAGWKMIFVRDEVQCGLAPDSLYAHVKQQIRWIDSGISVHKRFRFYLPGFGISMPWTQRVVGIVQVLKEYLAVPRLVAILLFPFALLSFQSGDLSIERSMDQQDQSRLRLLFLVTYLSQKLNTYVLYRHVGLKALKNMQSNRIWGALFNAHRCIASLFPGDFPAFEFVPSGSILLLANERSRNRKSLVHRLSSLDMIWYSSLVIYNALPLLFHVLKNTRSCLYLSTGALLALLECAGHASVPLVYMASPPTMPVRTELLESDKHGVRRPRMHMRKAKGEGSGQAWMAWWNAMEVIIIYRHDWS